MTDLIRIDLSDRAVDAIADRVAERLGAMLASKPDPWITAVEAATHLGISVDSLHKLTSAREIPFSQNVAGGKLWFRRAELDTWRDGRR